MTGIEICGRDGLVKAVAIVDDADFEALSRYRWSLTRNGYAVRATRIGGRSITFYMHREILGCTAGDGVHTDHVNGDRLDNRRANLKAGTQQQNNLNMPSRGGQSRHRGVIRHKGKWVAQAQYKGRMNYLGRFAHEHEAAAVVVAFWAARGVETRERVAA